MRNRHMLYMLYDTPHTHAIRSEKPDYPIPNTFFPIFKTFDFINFFFCIFDNMPYNVVSLYRCVGATVTNFNKAL